MTKKLNIPFSPPDITEEEIQKLIDERTAAKKSKDFARADEIRNELLEKGVVIEDTRAGVRWSYK